MQIQYIATRNWLCPDQVIVDCPENPGWVRRDNPDDALIDGAILATRRNGETPELRRNPLLVYKAEVEQSAIRIIEEVSPDSVRLVESLRSDGCDEVATAVLAHSPPNPQLAELNRFDSLKEVLKYGEDPVGILDKSEHITDEFKQNLKYIFDKVMAQTEELYGKDVRKLIEARHVLCTKAYLQNKESFYEQTDAVIQLFPFEKREQASKAIHTLYLLWNAAERAEIYRKIMIEGRSDTLVGAIGQLKSQGKTYQQVFDRINRMRCVFTFTMHPTDTLTREERILQATAELCLLTRVRPEVDAIDKTRATEKLDRIVSYLLTDEETRWERPTILEEGDTIREYLQTTAKEAVEKTMQAIRAALKESYPGDYKPYHRIHCPMEYDAWVGTDGDGNPNQTAKIAQIHFLRDRKLALQDALAELKKVENVLGISTHYVPHDVDKLEISNTIHIRRLRGEYKQTVEQLGKEYDKRPYLLKIKLMQLQLQRELDNLPTEKEIGDHMVGIEKKPLRWHYTTEDYVNLDWELILITLEKEAEIRPVFQRILESETLRHAYACAQVFGLHYLSNHARQEAKVFTQTVDFIMADKYPEYAEIGANKAEMLTEELLLPSTEAELQGNFELELALLQEKLSNHPHTFKLIEENIKILDEINAAIRVEPKLLKTQILSMTMRMENLLELLLVYKKTGILEVHADSRMSCRPGISPLFEVLRALKDSYDIMQSTFKNAAIREFLDAQKPFHNELWYMFVFWGYSDGHKDAGPAATLDIYEAREKNAKLFKSLGALLEEEDCRGAIRDRGEERPNIIVSCIPPAVWDATQHRFDRTIQGEGARKGFNTVQMTLRQYELYLGTMLLRDDEPKETPPVFQRFSGVFKDASHALYKEFIEDPSLWHTLENGPIKLLGIPKFANRQLFRHKGEPLTLGNARAISLRASLGLMQFPISVQYSIGESYERAKTEVPLAWPQVISLKEGYAPMYSILRRGIQSAERYDRLMARRWGVSPRLIQKYEQDMSLMREHAREANGNGHDNHTELIVSDLMPLRIPLRNSVNVDLQSSRHDLAMAGEGMSSRWEHYIYQNLLSIFSANQEVG